MVHISKNLYVRLFVSQGTNLQREIKDWAGSNFTCYKSIYKSQPNVNGENQIYNLFIYYSINLFITTKNCGINKVLLHKCKLLTKFLVKSENRMILYETLTSAKDMPIVPVPQQMSSNIDLSSSSARLPIFSYSTSAAAVLICQSD